MRELRVPQATGVLDVGGGTSFLVDRLIERGFVDISVLDISEVALEAAHVRVGPDRRVHWLHEDVLSWTPRRKFDLWHDRALFHFLVEESVRERYLSTLRSALRNGGFTIVATFAEDGPECCSGLPVSRYSAEALARETRRGLHPGALAERVAHDASWHCSTLHLGRRSDLTSLTLRRPGDWKASAAGATSQPRTRRYGSVRARGLAEGS